MRDPRVRSDKTKRQETIAWLTPGFSAGSGGHRTIFSNFNYLAEHGYKCDLYVNGMQGQTAEEIAQFIKAHYGKLKGKVYVGYCPIKRYDMHIATMWDTAQTIAQFDTDRKVYFIQDYEPWFYPVGDDYLAAKNSYRLNLRKISIGRWLPRKLADDSVSHFDFCVDPNLYHPLKDVERKDAICAVFQPNKPRRCHQLLLETLKLVQKSHPKTKIYLFGSPKCEIKDLKCTHLGVITPRRCNRLYNQCAVGLCLSLTNPSRIPFEMLAAGLPVVELDRENNRYDLPEKGVLLAEPSPSALASALTNVLDNPKLQRKLSRRGSRYLRKYPLEKGYRQFLKFVDEYFMEGKNA